MASHRTHHCLGTIARLVLLIIMAGGVMSAAGTGPGEEGIG